jgi:hypothetical protein
MGQAECGRSPLAEMNLGLAGPLSQLSSSKFSICFFFSILFIIFGIFNYFVAEKLRKIDEEYSDCL